MDLAEPDPFHAGHIHARQHSLAASQKRFQRVLAVAGEEVLVAEQVRAEQAAVEALLALGAGVDPQLADLRLIDEHVVLQGPVADARCLGPVEALLALERLAVANQEPDAVVTRVDEDACAAAALLPLEPVIQVTFEVAADGRVRQGKGRDLDPAGLVALEGARPDEELLGVLAFEKMPVQKPGLHGDVGRRVVVPLFQCQAGGVEQGVHAMRRRHLVHEEEGVKQVLRQARPRVHEETDQRLVVDWTSAWGTREDEAARLEEGAVRLEEGDEPPRCDGPEDLRVGEASESKGCHVSPRWLGRKTKHGRGQAGKSPHPGLKCTQVYYLFHAGSKRPETKTTRLRES